MHVTSTEVLRASRREVILKIRLLNLQIEVQQYFFLLFNLSLLVGGAKMITLQGNWIEAVESWRGKRGRDIGRGRVGKRGERIRSNLRFWHDCIPVCLAAISGHVCRGRSLASYLRGGKWQQVSKDVIVRIYRTESSLLSASFYK